MHAISQSAGAIAIIYNVKELTFKLPEICITLYRQNTTQKQEYVKLTI